MNAGRADDGPARGRKNGRPEHQPRAAIHFQTETGYCPNLLLYPRESTNAFTVSALMKSSLNSSSFESQKF